MVCGADLEGLPGGSGTGRKEEAGQPCPRWLDQALWKGRCEIAADSVTQRLRGAVGDWVEVRAARESRESRSSALREERGGPGSEGGGRGVSWNEGPGQGAGSEGVLWSCWPRGGEAVRLAAEEREGLIGGLASRAGGRDLITTIITIICLNFIAAGPVCPRANWIAQGPSSSGLGEARSFFIFRSGGQSWAKPQAVGRNWEHGEGRRGLRRCHSAESAILLSEKEVGQGLQPFPHNSEILGVGPTGHRPPESDWRPQQLLE